MTAANAPNLILKAYDHIQQGIITGRLKAGVVLSEAALAKKLGISRTPIGEAIRQLASEGLVQQVPRYGTIVRPLERQDLVELYEMREALESYAAAKAAARISDHALAQLQQLCDVLARIGRELEEAGAGELDGPLLKRFLAADMAFHMLVIEAAGNRRILKTVKESRTVSRIFRMRRGRHDLDVVHQAHAFHSRILDALRNRDAETARRHMLDHIEASKQQSLDHFDRDSSAADLSASLPADLLRELDSIEQSGEMLEG